MSSLKADAKGKDAKEVALQVLQNPDILEVLFKHLDFTRLKLIRTVCKTWNEEICRELKNRTVTYVQNRDEYSAVIKLLSVNQEKEDEPPEIIQELSVYVASKKMLSQVLLSPLPITKLHINPEVDFHRAKTTGQLHTLLAICCSTLTSLKISCCNIVATTDSSQQLEFPHLKELSLTVAKRDFYEDHNLTDPRPVFAVIPEKEDGAVSFFSKLISSAPKLSKLEIINYAGPLAKFLRGFKLEKITHLKIWTNGNPQDIVTGLKQRNFENLKSLSISSRDQHFQQSQLQEILERNSGNLESLSLDALCDLPVCPNLKHLDIRKFTDHCWDLSSFPNLNSIKIRKVESALSNTLHSCPGSVRTVEIGYGQKFAEVRTSLRKLYSFFSNSTTAWELPHEYVEDFCEFIATEREGKGVTSLVIGCEPYVSYKFYWLTLAKGLEQTPKLKDLEELTIRNNQSSFFAQTWNMFNPRALPNLHTFTYFVHYPADFTTFNKLVSKFGSLRSLRMLHNCPVALGAKAELLFSALPNATFNYEDKVVEEMYQADSEPEDDDFFG